MSRLLFLVGMLVLLCPLTATAGILDLLKGTANSEASHGTVPRAAQQIANQMDAQLMRRIGEFPEGRACVMITSTVAVSLSNLSESNPLSRQISEEVVHALMAKGYHASELRKSKNIVMLPHKGEMTLTRNLPDLSSRNVKSVAVLAGTYVITPDNVRFNMRLLHVPSNEILASGSATVPVTFELQPLLSDEKKKAGPPQPSVFTRLPD
jgi:hypothetical protein